MKKWQSNEFKRALNAFYKCNKVIRANNDEAQLLKDLCKVIVHDAGYRLAWVGYKEAGKERRVSPVSSYGFDDGYIEKADIVWSESERGFGPTGTAIRQQKPVVCQNITIDAQYAPWREDALKRGYASSIALPLIINDIVIGALNIYAIEPNAFDSDEVELLQEMTDALSFGISHIRQNKRLVESEERYRSIFNETIVPVLIINPETLEFKDVNEMACKYYGYTKDEFLKMRLPDIQTLPEEKLKVIASEVVAKKRNLLTTRHRTSKMEVRDVEIYTGPVTIEGKTAICSTIHDITERKRLEEELKAINLRLRKKVEDELAKNENMINGYAYCEMIYDSNNHPSDFMYLEVNKSFEMLTGLEREKVIHKRVTEVFPSIKEHNPELIEIYGNVASGGGAINYELLFEPLNIWLNINVYSPKKGYFVAIFDDYTERKNMETALRDSEEKYRLIFKHENDAICLCDANTLELIDLNDAFINLYGYNKDDMKDKTVDILSAEPEKNMDTIHEAINSGSAIVSHRLHKHRDGTVFHVEMSIGTFTYRGRRVLCIISRDITQRIRLEEELRQITVNLEKRVAEEVEKNRAKDQIVYEQSRHLSMSELLVNISHHWRQPLCGVAVSVQDIRDAYLHNELDAAYLDKNIKDAMSELKVLSNTIDNFRNFYIRNEQQTQFNISSEINKAESLILGYAADMVIDKELDETLMTHGNPNDFAHVILNILTNARDTFQRMKLPRGIIRIKLYKDDAADRKIITIANNGGEIPDEIKSRVFDPYFTTKDKARGTGMGLYMAKVIIENNMNGTISLRNYDGWCELRIEL
ncbi:PAS domain S-box protein [Candidatus Magnetominusculus xianensis]|uniref:Multi-sensor signal transduction histidine kinase n=1 Tax=Candidatus Magnetominusculus xianensis TaxID=1748249 RepID=A0ABR5SN72_9BACT|nr:PAS domain S-box protein [Candidatus Magnetominusculus xianensis]KWT94485.1 multi-sensor signal transduction histidine kinase [Candidatus Magnetominusculus xianensis]MBF0405122.1 PAS domain S-box protein [Nitrospirota bacterium]